MLEKQIVENFSNLSVLIVGDVMLDRYWWGSVSRISPEAPVPVVNLENSNTVAGGAANVAANVAGLGATPILLGVVGKDAESKLMAEALVNKNIKPDYLIELPNRCTTVKTRIVAHSQQIVRVDQEIKKNLTASEEEILWEKISESFDKCQITIISDYGKGVITENILSRLITKARQADKLVIVDPKGKNYEKYRGATMLTPNRFEVAEVFQMENFEQMTIENAGRQMIEDFELSAMLITQGEAGMTLFEKNGEAVHLPVTARNVYDVTGAGDTVIACLATAVGAGANLFAAAEFANIAAGLVVEKVGTTAITLEMLESVKQFET